jgi:hypothetical protein
MRWQMIIVFVLFSTIAAQFDQLDVTVKGMSYNPIDEHSVIDLRNVKFRKFNRTTQLFKGEFEVFVDHDNKISVRWTYHGKING